MFDAPAGAQMSFFPSEAEQIQFIAEAESVTPSAFSMFISQDDIDHILRAGGNADAARMKIAAEFSKQKPLEDRAAFLKALYYGGNGLITDNGRLSAWYGDDGIHIATGDTSRYLRSAQVIGWADAAERIEELLDGGAFATNLEVTEALRYERLGIAVDVWNLYHDFSDEAKSLGYLSCLGNIHSTSFPEETERLTDDLLNPAFRDRLLSEYKVFMDAYRENRALLRFHYHKSQALLTRLEDLSLPRKEFRSDMAAIPATGRFITEDEISASLANGSSFEGGKTRIYAFFQTSHTPKENADFLKKEYGIGGHTHAVSRESGSYEDHGSKGITLKKAGCADVQMNWNKVASRISELIRMNRYFTPDEQALYDKAQAQDVVRNTAYDSYNAIKEAHPDNIVLFQVGDFFEMYGEDAKQAVELLDMNLTTRNIPGAGRVEMCGLPSNNLEMYVEKLRDKYDVTIAEASDFRGERHIYTLRSIDHEAEASIDVQETEFGADGSNVFHDPAADVTQPTVRELFDGYKLTVGNALSKDTAFVNACRNSDRQNAYLEGADAIRRIVTASDDLQLVRLYFDMPAFHNRLHQELLEELYPTLAATVAPSPYQITQEDIDNALLDWHNNLKGKQEVALYMQAHGRERSTAAWLAAKYGWEDSKTPMYIHVGNAEPVTLTWAQVQRRLAQLIRENKFYDENERLRLFSPDRYSIRLHPGEGGITGIWDEVLERFCGDGEQMLRFAEQNNAIAYLDGIKRDMGIELSPPAFTTPLGYTYHIGDRISSIELDHIAAVGVIARVDEDHVWHTLGFHAAAQKRLVEELIVSASDILRCGVGDVFLIRLPSHLVAVLRHECDELLTGSTVLHSFLNGTAQLFLPSRNTEWICLALGEGQAILPAELVAVFLGLLHLPGALMKLLAVFKVYRIHDDVIVDVRRIHMRDHHALVALEVFRKLQPNLMRCIKIQRIVRGEGLDDVIIATAICFAELFLYRFEFILSCLSHAVDTGYETLHRFLTVCNIVQDTAQTA